MADQAQFTDLINRVRDAMNAHGPNTIRSLQKCFNITGECPNRRVPGQDFGPVMESNGCVLAEEDRVIFRANLLIGAEADYDKFYAELTGGLNDNRMACVH